MNTDENRNPIKVYQKSNTSKSTQSFAASIVDPLNKAG